MERIPVFVPHIGIDTMKHLMDAFDVGWLGMGASTHEFEERIAEYLGLKDRYVAVTNTGTSALHIACMAAGIGEGDEVICPSFNYVADHQAINASRAEVVFVDITEEANGIDCEKAEQLVTARTKGIMPLHFAGWPCDQAGVYRLAQKHGLRVIEDCAHAFGTEIDGRKIGSYGDIACFSFDPVKIMTSIDGGAVVVNTKAELEKLRHLRLLGVDKDTTERYKNKRAWEYDVVGPGYRYHMTNIFASVGISQIKRIDELISTRRDVCRKFTAAFADLPGFVVPRTDFSNVSPWIYSLRVLGNAREKFIAHMSARGIDVGIHFHMGAHEFTHYRGARRGDMSVTEKIAAEVVTLPLHSHMKPLHVERVIEGVTSFRP